MHPMTHIQSHVYLDLYLLRAPHDLCLQVGSYAFTTLRPQLGSIMYEDGAVLVAADIPGGWGGLRLARLG